MTDQDVWNALLAAAADETEVEVLEGMHAPHPPFAGPELVDTARLRCRYADGVEPLFSTTCSRNRG